MDDAGAARTGLESVVDAYESWASAYVELFGSAEKASDADRALVAGWAATVSGRVLDAGCGPGHWSAFLRSRHLDVEGVDATPAFIEHAARAHPEIPFSVGDLREIDLEPASLGGVLAWFSLIHLHPEEVPGVLQRFAAALRPGGSVLIGFFSGDVLRAFDHRVVTAWAWPLGDMTDAVERVGLQIVSRSAHRQPNGRVAAELVARRPHPAAFPPAAPGQSS